MRRFLLVLAIWSPMLAADRAATAAPTADGAAPPSAAALVEEIIRVEGQIHELRSLYLRFEGKWTRPPEAIARRKADLERKFPKMVASPERFSDLRPEVTEELELAFDAKRVRKLAHWHKASWNLRVFDGQRAISHERYFTHEQEHYAFDVNSQKFFNEPFTDLSCLRMGAHDFGFWKDPFPAADRQQSNGLPIDYALVGEADFRGRRCYVLENPQAKRRLHVGVEDGRLYGLTYLIVPRDADLLPVFGKVAGRVFAKVTEFDPWLKALSPDEQRKAVERLHVEMFPLARPWAAHVMDDYRELAPGFWFPARQGYTLFDLTSAQSKVDVERELRLVESRVNEPLDDALFAIDLVDGVQVYDWGHDPPLFYKQKKDRTPEEWRQIVDEHRQKSDEWKKEQATRDVLVGQPAPELPAKTWLHTAPLDLASLAGKVVVLDFWATNCGPCRNDLPIAQAVHQDRDESGIVVIGVHASGADASEVEAFAKSMRLTYPIVIDLPAPKERLAFGLLSSQLNVRGIPYSYVIDRQGRIAGHGSLHETMAKARQLAAEPAK